MEAGGVTGGENTQPEKKRRRAFDLPEVVRDVGISRREYHLFTALAHITDEQIREAISEKNGELISPLSGISSTRSSHRVAFLKNFCPDALEDVLMKKVSLSVAELAVELALREQYAETYGRKAGSRRELIAGLFRRGCRWPGCEQEIPRGAGLAAKWCPAHRKAAKRRSHRETYRDRKEKRAPGHSFPEVSARTAAESTEKTIETVVVRCPSCGRRNRIRLDRVRKGQFACGECRAELSPEYNEVIDEAINAGIDQLQRTAVETAKT